MVIELIIQRDPSNLMPINMPQFFPPLFFPRGNHESLHSLVKFHHQQKRRR
jgi:hypothetical protein